MTGKQPRLRDFQLLAPRSVLVALRFCCSLRHGEAIKSADQHRLVPGLLSYSCHDSQQLATETDVRCSFTRHAVAEGGVKCSQ